MTSFILIVIAFYTITFCYIITSVTKAFSAILVKITGLAEIRALYTVLIIAIRTVPLVALTNI
jgi:hypothetical protein